MLKITHIEKRKIKYSDDLNENNLHDRRMPNKIVSDKGENKKASPFFYFVRIK